MNGLDFSMMKEFGTIFHIITKTLDYVNYPYMNYPSPVIDNVVIPYNSYSFVVINVD